MKDKGSFPMTVIEDELPSEVVGKMLPAATSNSPQLLDCRGLMPLEQRVNERSHDLELGQQDQDRQQKQHHDHGHQEIVFPEHQVTKKFNKDEKFFQHSGHLSFWESLRSFFGETVLPTPTGRTACRDTVLREPAEERFPATSAAPPCAG